MLSIKPNPPEIIVFDRLVFTDLPEICQHIAILKEHKLGEVMHGALALHPAAAGSRVDLAVDEKAVLKLDLRIGAVNYRHRPQNPVNQPSSRIFRG